MRPFFTFLTESDVTKLQRFITLVFGELFLFKTKMIQHIEHHIQNWFVWFDIHIKLFSTLYAQRININNEIVFNSRLSIAHHTQSILNICHHLFVLFLSSSNYFNEFVFEIEFGLIERWWEEWRKEGGQIERHEQWTNVFIFR